MLDVGGIFSSIKVTIDDSQVLADLSHMVNKMNEMVRRSVVGGPIPVFAGGGAGGNAGFSAGMRKRITELKHLRREAELTTRSLNRMQYSQGGGDHVRKDLSQAELLRNQRRQETQRRKEDRRRMHAATKVRPKVSANRAWDPDRRKAFAPNTYEKVAMRYPNGDPVLNSKGGQKYEQVWGAGSKKASFHPMRRIDRMAALKLGQQAPLSMQTVARNQARLDKRLQGGSPIAGIKMGAVREYYSNVNAEVRKQRPLAMRTRNEQGIAPVGNINTRQSTEAFTAAYKQLMTKQATESAQLMDRIKKPDTGFKEWAFNPELLALEKKQTEEQIALSKKHGAAITKAMEARFEAMNTQLKSSAHRKVATKAGTMGRTTSVGGRKTGAVTNWSEFLRNTAPIINRTKPDGPPQELLDAMDKDFYDKNTARHLGTKGNTVSTTIGKVAENQTRMAQASAEVSELTGKSADEQERIAIAALKVFTAQSGLAQKMEAEEAVNYKARTKAKRLTVEDARILAGGKLDPQVAQSWTTAHAASYEAMKPSVAKEAWTELMVTMGKIPAGEQGITLVNEAFDKMNLKVKTAVSELTMLLRYLDSIGQRKAADLVDASSTAGIARGFEVAGGRAKIIPGKMDAAGLQQLGTLANSNDPSDHQEAAARRFFHEQAIKGESTIEKDQWDKLISAVIRRAKNKADDRGNVYDHEAEVIAEKLTRKGGQQEPLPSKPFTEEQIAQRIRKIYNDADQARIAKDAAANRVGNVDPKYSSEEKLAGALERLSNSIADLMSQIGVLQNTKATDFMGPGATLGRDQWTNIVKNRALIEHKTAGEQQLGMVNAFKSSLQSGINNGMPDAVQKMYQGFLTQMVNLTKRFDAMSPASRATADISGEVGNYMQQLDAAFQEYYASQISGIKEKIKAVQAKIDKHKKYARGSSLYGEALAGIRQVPVSRSGEEQTDSPYGKYLLNKNLKVRLPGEDVARTLSEVELAEWNLMKSANERAKIIARAMKDKLLFNNPQRKMFSDSTTATPVSSSIDPELAARKQALHDSSELVKTVEERSRNMTVPKVEVVAGAVTVAGTVREKAAAMDAYNLVEDWLKKEPGRKPTTDHERDLWAEHAAERERRRQNLAHTNRVTQARSGGRGRPPKEPPTPEQILDEQRDAIVRKASMIGDRVGRLVSGILLSRVVYDVTQAMRNMVASTIEFNNNMQEAKISFGIMLNDIQKADRFMTRLQDYSTRTPMSVEQMFASTRMLLAMGAKAGLNSENVLDMMTTVQDASVASGGGMASVTAIAETLGRMLSRDIIAMRELNALGTHGIPVFAILQEELKLTKLQVRDIAKAKIPALKGVNAILDGMKKLYGGATEEIAKTTRGLTRSIFNNARIAVNMGIDNTMLAVRYKLLEMRTWAEGLVDAGREHGTGGMFEYAVPTQLQEPIRALIVGVQHLVAAFKKLHAAYAPIINGFLKGFGGALAIIMPILNAVIHGIISITTVLMAWAPLRAIVEGLAIAIGGLMTILAVAKAFSLASVLITAGLALVAKGFGAISLAAFPFLAKITLIIFAIMTLASLFPRVRAGMNDVLQAMKELMGLSTKPILQPVLGDVNEEADEFSALIASTLAKFEEGVEDSVGKFTASFDEVFQVPDENADMASNLANLSVELDKVKEKFADLEQKNFFPELQPIGLSVWFENLMQDIKDFASDKWAALWLKIWDLDDAIDTWYVNTKESFVKGWQDFWAGVGNWGETAWVNFWMSALDLKATIDEWYTNTKENTRKMVEQYFGITYDEFKAGWRERWNTLIDLKDTFVAWLGATKENMKTSVSEFFATNYDGFKAFWADKWEKLINLKETFVAWVATSKADAKTAASEFFSVDLEGFKATWGERWEKLLDLKETITAWADKTGTQILDWFAGLPDRMLTALKDLPTKFREALAGLPAEAEKIIKDILGPFAWIYDAIAGIKGLVTGTKPPSASFNPQSNYTLPHGGNAAAYNGGVVTREQLVRVGEKGRRETILPLSETTLQPFADMISDRMSDGLAMVSGGNTRPQLYVQYLIADDQGLRELNRRMDVIQLQEQTRRGKR